MNDLEKRLRKQAKTIEETWVTDTELADLLMETADTLAKLEVEVGNAQGAIAYAVDREMELKTRIVQLNDILAAVRGWANFNFGPNDPDVQSQELYSILNRSDTDE